MDTGLIKIYFGEGKGKSMASLGRALVCASEGKEVFVVQFLKGRLNGNLDFLKQLEPELKMFRFEKEECYYESLSDADKADEVKNIRNGLNFVRKVLTIGECDVLILDEILGLVDLGIISVEEVITLLNLKRDDLELILTGRNLPEPLINQADYISRLDIIKIASDN